MMNRAFPLELKVEEDKVNSLYAENVFFKKTLDKFWTEVFPLLPYRLSTHLPDLITPPPPHAYLPSIVTTNSQSCHCGFFRPVVAYFFTITDHNHYIHNQ